MFRIIDRYLLSRFLKTLLLAIIAFIGIFIIVNLVEKIDVFIDKDTSLKVIILYYLYWLPYYLNFALPIAMLLAVLFTISQFVKHGELTALKSAGISLYRISLPIIVFGIFIYGFALWFGERVVPKNFRNQAELYREKIKKVPNIAAGKNNITFQEKNNRIVTIGQYDSKQHIGSWIIIQKKKGNHIESIISAQSIIPDKKQWILLNGKIRDFSSGEEVITRFDERRVTDFTITEDDLISVQIAPDEMNAQELKKYITKLRQIGSPFERWEVEYYWKFAFPFANLIVILLGLPLAVYNWRGGPVMSFGICIFICFIYWAIILYMLTLGDNKILPPIFAAWFSNIVFGMFGIFGLMKART